MVSASRYEREFISWASRIGLVARTAASGTLNTIVGDLVVIPHSSYGLPPIIVEVKSTRREKYYPSKDIRNLELMRSLSREFNFIPILAVRFIGHGWKIIDIRDGVPFVVTPEGAEFIGRDRKTLADWLRDPSPDDRIKSMFDKDSKGGGAFGDES